MIVTCPQCQTRFRIPDERVTAKGVKVRCTRCRHTFRVSRPAEPVEAAEDPFAQFSPPDALSEADKTPARGISVAAALGVEVEPAGRPSADDFDVDVETPDAKRREPPSRSFPPPPPPPHAPDPPQVAAPPPPLEPPFDIPEDPTPRVALARIAMVRQLTVVPPPSPPPPPPPAPEPVQEQAAEFSDFEGPPDERLELDTGAHQSAWQGSLEGGLELPPAPASAEFDFGDLNLDTASAPPSQPSHTPPPPPPAATTPTPTPERAVGHLDFGAMDSPPTPVPVRPVPPPKPDFSFGELDLAPTPAPRTESALDLSELPSTTPVPEPGTKTPTGELFGKSATPLDEESFPVDNRTADRAALFDMSVTVGPPAATTAEPTSLLADVPDAIPDAPVHPAVGLPAVPATPLGRVSRPPTGTSVLGLEERRERGTAQRLSGTVGNIGVAAVLVIVLAAVGNVYVNEGRLDWAALSPGRWAALFVPPSGIVTLDVTNGLYETRGGRPLAYVRGRVENRGQRPGQVKVRAEIWDGSQLLGSSEGLAGVLPTPEDMVEASTRRDVEALRARLQQGAPAVPAGKGTDFVLLFDEPPADVSGLRLKVTAAAAAADGR
jgi:predicted Zn finger-like uncharacterized protein